MKKTRVLFLCTHNSARSQMAEGYLRAKYGYQYDAFSAGTEVTQLHPLAIEAMREVGIDISSHISKGMAEFFDVSMDIVVTVCDGAAGVCPMFPGTKKTIHQVFIDPSTSPGTDEQKKELFRTVRDEIIRWIDKNVNEGGLLHLS